MSALNQPAKSGGSGGWIALGFAVAAAAGIGGYLLGRSSERERVESEERENPVVLRRNDLGFFNGAVECAETSELEVENQYSCGSRDNPGRWTTRTVYPDSESARTHLALTPMNCADTVMRVVTKPGTVRCRGRVSPAYGQIGGGDQTLTYETEREWFE